MPDMLKKVPSYLKGLAETRARAAADITRYSALRAELDRRLGTAQRALESADTLIRQFDERLDPSQIAPVQGRGRYGKRGELKNGALRYLQDHPGEAIPTNEIAIAMEAKFGLLFFTPKEQSLWRTNCLGNRLRDMARNGQIERVHDPLDNTGEVGRWRWKPQGASLSELQAEAEAQGGTVTSHQKRKARHPRNR